MTQQAEVQGHWFQRRSRSTGVLDTFKLTRWADKREICCLGGFDLCMSSQTPGNLSKTCTADGWTEMHPFDIAVNCGYNLNGTGDDVSTPPLSIRSSRADTQWSQLWMNPVAQCETGSRASRQEEFNKHILSLSAGGCWRVYQENNFIDRWFHNSYFFYACSQLFQLLPLGTKNTTECTGQHENCMSMLAS